MKTLITAIDISPPLPHASLGRTLWDPGKLPPSGELPKLCQLDQPILRAWSSIRDASGDHPQDTKGSLCVLPRLLGLTSLSIAYVCLERPCLFPLKQDGFKPSVYQQGWQLLLPGENWEPSSLLSSWNCIAEQTAPWLVTFGHNPEILFSNLAAGTCVLNQTFVGDEGADTGCRGWLPAWQAAPSPAQPLQPSLWWGGKQHEFLCVGFLSLSKNHLSCFCSDLAGSQKHPPLHTGSMEFFSTWLSTSSPWSHLSMEQAQWMCPIRDLSVKHLDF